MMEKVFLFGSLLLFIASVQGWAQDEVCPILVVSRQNYSRHKSTHRRRQRMPFGLGQGKGCRYHLLLQRMLPLLQPPFD